MLDLDIPPMPAEHVAALTQLLHADDAAAALLLFRDGRCEGIATYRSAGQHVASYDTTGHPLSQTLTPAAAYDAEKVHTAAGLRPVGPASCWYPSKPPTSVEDQ